MADCDSNTNNGNTLPMVVYILAEFLPRRHAHVEIASRPGPFRKMTSYAIDWLCQFQTFRFPDVPIST